MLTAPFAHGFDDVARVEFAGAVSVVEREEIAAIGADGLGFGGFGWFHKSISVNSEKPVPICFLSSSLSRMKCS